MTALPPIAGREDELQTLMRQDAPIWRAHSNLALDRIRSGFACALHMHQPTIPAGGNGALISHLQYMFEHQGEGDNHNAEPFAQCYRRLADLIPQLISDGCNPRIMLDYSGNLLWGVEQIGRTDITASLRHLACDPVMQRHVEWLGTFWSHAVAPSTPIPDLKLQISAWQHQFAALFGTEALQRVRGFSPPEMHLPNHPDTLYEFISALKDCGYRWLLVQEHSVETLSGEPLSQSQKYLPNQLTARNSSGDTVSITALIKTQGSDTKLVGQMQPCYEALGLQRQQLGDISIPSLVSQIADGENGGVMMNEFPSAFQQANQRIRDDGNDCVAINGSEYLELLDAAGVGSDRFPVIQAVQQQRLWAAVGETATPEAVQTAIASLQAAGDGFSMEGASWTNNLSWVQGYDNVLEPMNQLSARFHQTFDQQVSADPAVTGTPAYQEALLHLLLLETSCFRYWGQGTWTDYARTIHQRGEALLTGSTHQATRSMDR
ncbi:MAG: glycosyl hydrolase family 57 [Synechococcus sp. BS301-5m-G54]|nr:glycosyl hydrolase family 57 [Synechococcus sp. BS301-5m-G54]MBL6796684.1 glycosyl hydrolase family 57 [Synechococcus sp. BS307-5m-G34]